jgi:ubiquinone biosynthesis protein
VAKRERLTAGERLHRVRRISTTFGRIYLGIKANQFIARRLAPSNMQERWSRFHRESAEAIFEAALDLRGLILKGCQFLGSRADVLPPEYIEILSELQDRVPPSPFTSVREIVEMELGAPIDSLFEYFCEIPVASASLAQVHEARLFGGQRVAVKVQYPEIGDLVRSDLANLRGLFLAVGWIERELDLMPLIEELGEHVPLELDFVSEGHNAEAIGEFFVGRGDVVIPQIHWEYTTARVLVMEFIDGIKITNVQELLRHGVDTTQVMRSLIELYSVQILTHGFFHADPHPGNLMVLPAEPQSNAASRVVMIDFGLAKRLPKAFRETALRFASALFEGNPDVMARALVDLGFETKRDPVESLEAISAILLDIAKRLRRQSFVDPKVVRSAAKELPRLIRENPIVRVPSHVVLLARVFTLLSGLGSSLDAHVDMLQTILPYVIPPAEAGSRGAAESRQPIGEQRP